MTRRSNLSAVPTAAGSPLPADQPVAATRALTELRSLRGALQDARRAAGDVAGVISRSEAVVRRGSEVRTELAQLEREAGAAMSGWVLSGAHSAPPQLMPEQQAALRAARQAAEDTRRDAEAVEAQLPILRERLGNLQRLIAGSATAIRSAALEALAAETEPLLQAYHAHAAAGFEVRKQLLGLLAVLSRQQYGAVWTNSSTYNSAPLEALRERIANAGRAPSEISAAQVEPYAEKFQERLEALISGDPT